MGNYSTHRHLNLPRVNRTPDTLAIKTIRILKFCVVLRQNIHILFHFLRHFDWQRVSYTFSLDFRLNFDFREDVIDVLNLFSRVFEVYRPNRSSRHFNFCNIWMIDHLLFLSIFCFVSDRNLLHCTTPKRTSNIIGEFPFQNTSLWMQKEKQKHAQ